MTEELVLEMHGITKRFPGIVANDHVDLDVRKAEVHALLGENGAGKSTLMNILYGLYKPDEGEIRLAGEPVVFGSAKDAIRAGIGMVHQHFMLIPVMTVAENIVLGNEPTREGIILDERGAEERVREISTSRARARRRSRKPRPRVCSRPSMTFSATVNAGISMKCWCTIPIPWSIAPRAD